MSDSYSTSYDWANNRDHQEYQQYDRKKETIKRSTSQFQRATIYQPEATHNSYTSELEGNSQELFFSNEKSLVNWLRIRPDLIIQVQSSSTAYFHRFVIYYLVTNYYFIIASNTIIFRLEVF